MFKRQIETELLRWKQSEGRKPLVLRGARQTGKTTVVGQFAENYSQFIHLNLERKIDREFFTAYGTINETVQSFFFHYGKTMENMSDTLLFIDEIQQSPEAVAMLRYFYEDFPALHVIAAGSLLETLLGKRINFPVGRVEYRALRPVSFAEFLEAMGERQAFEMYCKTPLPDFN
jgi:predicted AAA+ superfamily ATPase